MGLLRPSGCKLLLCLLAAVAVVAVAEELTPFQYDETFQCLVGDSFCHFQTLREISILMASVNAKGNPLTFAV